MNKWNIRLVCRHCSTECRRQSVVNAMHTACNLLAQLSFLTSPHHELSVRLRKLCNCHLPPPVKVNTRAYNGANLGRDKDYRRSERWRQLERFRFPFRPLHSTPNFILVMQNHFSRLEMIVLGIFPDKTMTSYLPERVTSSNFGQVAVYLIKGEIRHDDLSKYKWKQRAQRMVIDDVAMNSIST